MNSVDDRLRAGLVASWSDSSRPVADGRFRLRRLDMGQDMPTVHGWVSRRYARYWGLTGQSLLEVTRAYVDIARHADVYLGFRGDEPVFLLECYAPEVTALREHYAVQPGDRGMHILLAPPERPEPGFSWAVFCLAMEFLFSDPSVERIVVEPDIRNHKIHALNRRAGFHYQKVAALPGKTAHLAFCTRAQYRAALQPAKLEPATAFAKKADAALLHLTPEHWAAVNLELVRKAIAEFSHERLLQPLARSEAGPGRCEYVLRPAGGAVEYRFSAQVLQLEHWAIEASSLRKTDHGAPAAVDAQEFVLEFAPQLGLSREMLPGYLEEIASTLYAAVYKQARDTTAGDLVHASFQEIEAAMTEGHPGFLANSGRVGFDAADFLAYAPEAAAPVQLVWLAAHRRHAEWNSAADLSYERLVCEELGAEALAAFAARLRGLGLAPQDYLLIPVHPWQWFNKLAVSFAPELAARELVCLGHGADRYQAQQSIRTLFNRSHPSKRYVKLALSVLNMGFTRGLSAEYMRGTPAINDFIDALLRSDPYFEQCGLSILREVAAVSYVSSRFDAAGPKSSPQRKLLAALFRESPVPGLRPGERLMTMAALLHRDRDGRALLPQLIEAAGGDIDAWLASFLRCYLAPLLHCFYRHDLAFMPHGENIILVLRDHLPVGARLKDIAEEAAIMDPERVLPERVARLRVAVPDALKPLCIFTDVFDGVLRFVAQILHEQSDYAEQHFWARVADCVLAYQHAHPELIDKFQRHDLFAPRFAHSCLNRLQLSNNQQMVDLADPAGNLKFAGSLANPIAPYRPDDWPASLELPPPARSPEA